MPTAHTMLLFLATSLPICLTPGPGMLYVLSRAAARGPAAGVASTLGLSVGTLLHTATIALGLSALLERVPLAYDVLRYAGALYLLYLGLRMWRSPAGDPEFASAAPTSLG